MTLNAEANQAPKGSTIWLYAAGAGATTPAGTDGAITVAEQNVTAPVAAVSIGGVDVTPDYFGQAPGLVTGLMLVKVKVPAAVAAGRAVPLVLTVGGVQSQAGVTIAVK
jgi:uncharacterized protein (TIGR03437 family)